MSNDQNVDRPTNDVERVFRDLDHTEAERALDEPCFVATVVYGNKNAPQVQTLRNFRDNVLRQNFIGKQFVNFYYGGAGKRIADFIRDSFPSAIPVIRKELDYFVENYSALNNRS